MKRFLALFALFLLTSKSIAQQYFLDIGPYDASLCDPNAATFPIHFAFSPTNSVVSPPVGTYTATLTDYFGVQNTASLGFASNGDVTAVFDLSGLGSSTFPGTVTLATPVGTYIYPFTINPCGVQLRLFGPTTIGQQRPAWYVGVVRNFGPGAASPTTLQVDGIPAATSATPVTLNVVTPGYGSATVPITEQGFTIATPSLTAPSSSPGYDPGSYAAFEFNITPLPFSSSGSYGFNINAAFTSGYSGGDSLPVNVVGSWDPNNKTGPLGEGPNRYLRGNTALSYTIEFENDPIHATAPAQKVFVTDQLDPSKVDLETFEFGPITFGRQMVTPTSGGTSFSATVPYHVAANAATTEADILVQIDGYLDVDLFSATYGQITWIFESIDPATGLPPQNVTIGFLPPNLNPAEGQGSVSYQILPQATLVTDDTISNQANIVFDRNDPILTPTWVNSIDKTAPESSVDPLEPAQGSPAFSVSWAGSDSGVGIARYTIYVSKDHGPYLPFLTGTTATSASFNGLAGHTYSFYSVATDLMGYVESAPAVPDTTTTVGGFLCPPDLVIVSDRAACNAEDHDDRDWEHHTHDGRHRDEHEDHSRCGQNHVPGDVGGHGYTCKYWSRCRATGVVLTPPILTDVGSIVSVVNDHPSTTYPLGVTLVSWSVTDISGNINTCVQNITVVASVEVSFASPVVRKPTGNTIRRGQIVPFKVDLESCLGHTVRSGVTVRLQVLGIDSVSGAIFEDVIEDANGLGTDGTVTSDGLTQLRNSEWQFNLDSSNFGDPNTVAGSRFYRATVAVIDNATLAIVGMGTVNLETRRK